MAVFIYGLECPIEKVIRYIGKAANPEVRFVNHITTARTGRLKHHNARWISKLLRQGLIPELKILAEVKDGERWQDVERRFIAEAIERGVSLKNTFAGGEGPDYLDPILRASVSAKMAQSHRNAWADPEKRKRFLKSAREPELLKRRSITQTRRNADPVYKAKQIATMKRVCSMPEYRVVASARAIAMHANPEQSARRIASIKAAYQKPEVKTRLAVAMTEVRARPAYLAARSAAMKAAWVDPEFRAKVHNDASHAKMSASQRKRFSDPAERERLLRLSSDTVRNATNAKLMAARNADPAFRARINDPEVKARKSASLRETWARRKREAVQQQLEAA